MGGGAPSEVSFCNYVTTKGCTTSYSATTGKVIIDSLDCQSNFKSRRLHESLNPFKVIRECCDSEEHPNTLPVILALDVTGSMGSAAEETAKKINEVMTVLFDKSNNRFDIEFLTMGIGDFYCDEAPLQASQFESDIRIVEQMDNIWFEYGGGGNSYESYSGAWYFGLHHCKLDCWNRGQKGIIITMGDELLNPYIPIRGNCTEFESYLGDTPQDNIDTAELYREVKEKYNIYHINVDHDTYRFNDDNVKSFAKVIGEDHVFNSTVNEISSTIISIIENEMNSRDGFVSDESTDGLQW